MSNKMMNHADIIEKFKIESWLPGPIKEILENHIAALMFVKELSIRIRNRFKSPCNHELAEIVNLLYGTEYTDNEIVKFTQKIRQSEEKSDDSAL